MIFKQCCRDRLRHAKAIASLSLTNVIFFTFTTNCCCGMMSEVFAITHKINWLLLLKHLELIIHCCWCSYWRDCRGHFCRQRRSINLISFQLLRLTMMTPTQINVDCFESCMTLIKHLKVKFWHFHLVISGIYSCWFDLLLLILIYLYACMKIIWSVCAASWRMSRLTLITLCLV